MTSPELSVVKQLSVLTTQLQRRAGERDKTRSLMMLAKSEAETLAADQQELQRALEIIQVTAKVTQQELEVHVSELASLALEAIFPDPYKLSLTFALRRNRSEADLTLVDGDDNHLQPMDAAGGGVVDITALALRISLWSLKQPRPIATLVMDEPCRFVSRDLQGRASTMIREVSKRLGIQFILVTHEENLTEAADKVFRVGKRDGVSKVEEVK